VKKKKNETSCPVRGVVAPRENVKKKGKTRWAVAVYQLSRPIHMVGECLTPLPRLRMESIRSWEHWFDALAWLLTDRWRPPGLTAVTVDAEWSPPILVGWYGRTEAADMLGVLGLEDDALAGGEAPVIIVGSDSDSWTLSRFEVLLDAGIEVGGGRAGVAARDWVKELSEVVEARLSAGVGTYSRSFVR
jgi:hypothetical protein